MSKVNLSVALGPRVLGAAAFAKQQIAASKESGSVGLGAEHDKKFVSRVKPAVVVEEKKVAAPAKVAVPKGKGAPKKPVVKSGPKAKAAKPTATSFSEADVERLLTADANAWPQILERETERAEGVRPKVAQLILEAAPNAQHTPVPPEILATLTAAATLAAE